MHLVALTFLLAATPCEGLQVGVRLAVVAEEVVAYCGFCHFVFSLTSAGEKGSGLRG